MIILRYITAEDRWEPVRSMKICKIGHGCAVVNRLLYAIGYLRIFKISTFDKRIDLKLKVALMEIKGLIKLRFIIRIKIRGYLLRI